MDFDLRRVHLLYAVGVLLGFIATVYFAFILLEDLSPTVTAVLLYLGFVFFGAAGLRTSSERLDTVFYALGAGAYLTGIWYTITRFEIGDVGVFLALAVSSGLFIALGYLSHEGHFDVNERTALIVMLAALVAGGAFLGADVIGPQPTVEVNFDSQVDIPDRGENVEVGSVTIRNDFQFSRLVDSPSFHACLYAPDRTQVFVAYEEHPRNFILPGRGSTSFDLVVQWTVFYETREDELYEPLRDRDSIPIETAAECPDASDEVKLVVVQGDLRSAALTEPARAGDEARWPRP